jgi:hypothetical protein
VAFSRGPQAIEAGPGVAPRPSGAHAAHAIGGGARTALHRGVTSGEQLRHDARQGLHLERPRRTVNTPDMARRTNSKVGGPATRKWKLTGAVDGAGAQ